MERKQREAADGEAKGPAGEMQENREGEEGGGLAKIKYVGKCHTETHFFVCWF